jgi:hypothetical protein
VDEARRLHKAWQTVSPTADIRAGVDGQTEPAAGPAVGHLSCRHNRQECRVGRARNIEVHEREGLACIGGYEHTNEILLKALMAKV